MKEIAPATRRLNNTVISGIGHIDWGLFSPSAEGTLQGGPLSPLLSNVVLYELDGQRTGETG